MSHIVQHNQTSTEHVAIDYCSNDPGKQSNIVSLTLRIHSLNVLQARVSIRRIDEFLNRDELDPSNVTHDPSEGELCKCVKNSLLSNANHLSL